jgi:hypothetical protein
VVYGGCDCRSHSAVPYCLPVGTPMNPCCLSVDYTD